VQCLQNGRIRPSLDASSVLVRIMDASRQGHLDKPCPQIAPEQLRLPGYTACLGKAWVAEMRKGVKNKTYSMVRPASGRLPAWAAAVCAALSPLSNARASPPPPILTRHAGTHAAAAGTAGPAQEHD
jgi:hypothetical protein